MTMPNVPLTPFIQMNKERLAVPTTDNGKKMNPPHAQAPLIDGFGRSINYLRLSVTDRCDFRCIYCMAEDMTFLPRKQVLSIEEHVLLCQSFVEMGTQKIRITGGEPLIRKGIIQLFEALGDLNNLKQRCLTTNGSQLHTFAKPLKAAGLNRINISLDTLDAKLFQQVTRHGDLNQILNGIDAALAENFDRVKINAVIMKNYNQHELANLTRFALERGMDITFIEEMPLGDITSHVRHAEFVASAQLREQLSRDFTLSACTANTGGPARYWRVEGYNNMVGFISPHSENFCSSCNRVRITASGRLLLCLGNEDSLDLRKMLRGPALTRQNGHEHRHIIQKSIRQAMQHKPEKHHFDLSSEPQILRFMNATGG